jgi:hypothetical protein
MSHEERKNTVGRTVYHTGPAITYLPWDCVKDALGSQAHSLLTIFLTHVLLEEAEMPALSRAEVSAGGHSCHWHSVGCKLRDVIRLYWCIADVRWDSRCSEAAHSTRSIGHELRLYACMYLQLAML